MLVNKLHSRTMTSYKKVLQRSTISKNVLRTQYAVRGELVLRSLEHKKALDKGNGSGLPFDSIVSCNIGNPHECGQEPLTFPRQVLSLVNCPQLLQNEHVGKLFPSDAIRRASDYLREIPGGVGAYSHSKGVEVVRKEVSDFLQKRDGFPSDPESIYLTDGASPAIQRTLSMVISDESCGIMIPIPQYPLYSAAITLTGGAQVGYFLNEDSCWGTKQDELMRSVTEARDKGINVKAMAVINPGNPTGQCLSWSDMEGIVSFCHDQNIMLMADEVYQENIWQDSNPFHSFKKVLRTMESKGKIPSGELELFSYHSTSKGFLGECGRRGGYMELTNIHDEAGEELYKLASLTLCSNLVGQLSVGLMVNPPAETDESYQQYVSERNNILESLRRRAGMLVKALNDLEGVSCQESQGAMYAFPKITLPEGAMKIASEMGKAADAYYCMELLDATGIVVVPGSGFLQEPNTFHFRTTILPQENEIQTVIERIKVFHSNFLRKHGGLKKSKL